MQKQKGFTVVELLAAITLIAGVVGWVLNIIAVAHADYAHLNGVVILRIIGIFIAPLGSVLGFF